MPFLISGFIILWVVALLYTIHPMVVLAVIILLWILAIRKGDWHGRWAWEERGLPDRQWCPVCGTKCSLYAEGELAGKYGCYKCAKTGLDGRRHYFAFEGTPDDRELSTSKLLTGISLIAIACYLL